MRTRCGLSAPCPCNFFSATARICGRTDAGALPIRASAALAWFLSGIGNDRPGPAKVDAGSARRLAAVSLATYHFPPGPFRSSSPVFPRLRVAELPCATAPRCTRGYGGASASCMSAKWDAFDAVASYSGRMVGPCALGFPSQKLSETRFPVGVRSLVLTRVASDCWELPQVERGLVAMDPYRNGRDER